MLRGVGPGAEPLPLMALFGLILGTFMGILDATIVNVALPRMMAVFNVTTSQIQWVLTAYLLVGGMVIPATGYLGDRFGYKRMYLFCIGLFTLSSILCGLAWNVNSLIVARAIQAIGGGMVIPLSMTIVYQIWPREKIGLAMSLWGVTMTLAPAIGPTLGGYLVDNFSWRLIFYINLPVGLLTILISTFFLTEAERITDRKLDVLGLFLSSVSCFLLLLALDKGQDWGWSAQSTVTLLVAASFGFLLFFFWELSVPEPVIDVRLLRNGIFSLALFTSSLVSVALFLGVFLTPLFTQRVQGYSPMQTGLILMPAALASGLMMPLAGKLFDRVGAALPGILGLSLISLTTYILRHVTVDMPVPYLQLLLSIRGLGLGLAMMPLMTAGMNAVPTRFTGQASALMNVIRQVAASFGISLVTYVFENRLVFHSERLTEGVSHLAPLGYFYYAQVAGKVGTVLGPGAVRPATEGLLQGAIQKQAATLAVGDAFLVATIIALLALPLAFVFTKGRIDLARREAEAALGSGDAGGSPVVVPEV